MNIYNFNLQLYKVTGIQSVLVDIHEALKDRYTCRIAGNIPYEKVNKDLGIKIDEYVYNRNYIQFRNSIVFIHERRLLLIFWFLNTFLFWNTSVVYVHHNELSGMKRLSCFPKHIVAISDSGIRNLTEYFKVDMSRITKIYNCTREPDEICYDGKELSGKTLDVLYPARVNDVKRQLELVKHLDGRLNNNIRILFAGEGPRFAELREICADSDQFVVLGYRPGIKSLLRKVNYVLLFSRHEGLPISLIEACMAGTPIICNAVGGNTEIALDTNSFVVNDWESLIDVLNNLPNVSATQYDEMCKHSRKIYEERFMFETFRQNYIELIDRIQHESNK